MKCLLLAVQTREFDLSSYKMLGIVIFTCNPALEGRIGGSSGLVG